MIYLVRQWMVYGWWACVSLLPAAAFCDDTFFENKIRPILSKHCYECHGSDTAAIKGGLRVDHAQGLLAGGDSGPALMPGEPQESLLMEALRYEGLEMPPAGKLPAEVIADFSQWIADGAADPRREVPTVEAPATPPIDIEKGRQFWAFQPVFSHATPEVSQTQWPLNFIDHFVLARLEAVGLIPNPLADRETLIRRLAFDLTGLPPRPEDVESYLQSSDPRWFEQYAHQLIESRQFGEHWGRHWLDVARYADSNGGDFNATFHNAWRYRNYVIDSFNSDRPLSEFIVQQIAGDLLPADSDEQRETQLVATAFLMLGTKMLSERDKAKLQMDVVDEQINTIGNAFLGMTLGCARCHDHKFDPIPATDYYALAGILKSTQTLEGEIQQYVSNWVRQPLPIQADHAAALEQYQQQSGQLKAAIKQAEERIKQLDSDSATAALLAEGVVIDDVDAEIVGQWKASTYSKEYVGKGYIHDDQQERGSKSVTFRTQLPAAGEYEIRLAFPGAKGRASNVPVRVRHRDGETELLVDQTQPAPLARLLKPIGRFYFDAEQEAVVVISNEAADGYVIADAVQLVAIEDLAEAGVEGQPRDVAELDRAKAELAELQQQLKDLEARSPPPAPLALAVQEAAAVGDCQVCIRGEVHNLGEVVPRGFLSVIDGSTAVDIAAGESGRLQLAHWLADSENPLTARVYVNRVWQHLMGEGLVRSVDNFGQLGQRPTHPELLDRLTREFVGHGGSTKWLVGQIVSSRAYQLSSRHDEAKWQVDPGNHALWRANRKRLSAEEIRDAMLQAAGRLNLSVGENPVESLGTLVTQNRADDQGYQQEQSSLRTVYLPVVRNELPTLMRVFDFADPDLVTGRRPETTVPAQALWLLNGPLVAELATAVVERLGKSDGESADEEIESQIRRAFVLVLGRPPYPNETDLAREVVSPLPPSQREAAWTDFVHALMASSTFRLVD